MCTTGLSSAITETYKNRLWEPREHSIIVPREFADAFNLESRSHVGVDAWDMVYLGSRSDDGVTL